MYVHVHVHVTVYAFLFLLFFCVCDWCCTYYTCMLCVHVVWRLSLHKNKNKKSTYVEHY